MSKFLPLSLAAAMALAMLSACESTDEAANVIVPDRDKEGFSGPGVRIANGNQLNTNRVEHLTQTEYAPRDYLRRQQEEPVEGIDFFQYKKKF
jgi:hypothetical protein